MGRLSTNDAKMENHVSESVLLADLSQSSHGNVAFVHHLPAIYLTGIPSAGSRCLRALQFGQHPFHRFACWLEKARFVSLLLEN